MVSDNEQLWRDKHWRVFCIGDLGALFYESFGEKLGKQFSLCMLETPEDLFNIIQSSSLCDEELWMLIAEYDQKIWESCLNNEMIKQALGLFSLKFTIIHPKNSIVPIAEQRFIRLMGLDPCEGKVILAMPEMNRRAAMETMCWTIYDMIAAIFLPGYVNIDLSDLVQPGRNSEWYGTVYEADCTHSGQMVQTAAKIKAQLEKEIPKEDRLFAFLFFTSDRNMMLSTMSQAAEIIDSSLNEYTELIWGHILTESECGMTLVVYRDIEGEWEKSDCEDTF